MNEVSCSLIPNSRIFIVLSLSETYETEVIQSTFEMKVGSTSLLALLLITLLISKGEVL